MATGKRGGAAQRGRRVQMQAPARRATPAAERYSPPTDEPEDEVVDDAQAMVSDEDADARALPSFLARSQLPSIATGKAHAQAQESTREARRHERQEMEEIARMKRGRAGRAPPADDESEGSTDMEGLSDSSGEEDSEAEDLSDLPELDVDDDSLLEDKEPEQDDERDERDLESSYLERAAKRSKREERELARQAQRRLPVRSETGELVDAESDEESTDGHAGSRAVYAEEPPSEDEEAEAAAAAAAAARAVQSAPSSAAHSTRFGMKAPFEIVRMAAAGEPATQRAGITMAREQIAQLSSQVVGDPELGLNWLRRLLVFAQLEVEPPPEAEKGGSKRKRADTSVPVHPYIRQLALLSLLAVMVDIIPGYRIRALSEKEQQERVGQEVARRREWEQGLVHVYRDYLACCEAELRQRGSPISAVALRCFCTLLIRVPHFNFRKNILAAVIAHLSRRAWTELSALCASSLEQLLQQDRTGEVSLEAVQLLYRMTRERHLAVHANVLDVLVHLRLRDELRGARTGPMGSASAAPPPKPVGQKAKNARQVRKGLATHTSKKQIKKNREIREIEREMREAEAQVDLEERERNQSETLKLVFALYFRVLKTPDVPQPLLASALEGIVQFAHHVSIDFFRDLIGVLRELLAQAMHEAHAGGEPGGRTAAQHVAMRRALLCIVAALELVGGQGESLQIDMGEFLQAAYQLLPLLSMSTCFEEGAEDHAALVHKAPPGVRLAGLRAWSEAELLFHVLDIGMAKAPRQTANMSIERTAAIVKRLLTSALQWPTGSVLRALKAARTILGRASAADSRLEALLDTRETVRDGQHDAYAQAPEAARVLASGEAAWELLALAGAHANAQVRETAAALLDWRP